MYRAWRSLFPTYGGNQRRFIEVTASQTQRISWIAAAEGDLAKLVEAFLLNRRIRGLAPGTLRFYQQKLALFQTFIEGQGIGILPQLTPTLIRQCLLCNTGHNSGSVHGCYRAPGALLNWWEEEMEPENGRDPIRKVKGPKVSAGPLPPADDWLPDRFFSKAINSGVQEGARLDLAAFRAPARPTMR